MNLQEMITFYTDLNNQITFLENRISVLQKENTDNINTLSKQIEKVTNERDNVIKSFSREASAQKVIQAGILQYGKPYKFGAVRGQTENFDCSSFTQYCFKKALNIDLRAASYTQAEHNGVVIDKLDNALPGDLLCFDVSNSRDTWQGIDHIGIYCGNNKILHTYKVGIGVVFEELTDARKNQLKIIKRII